MYQMKSLTIIQKHIIVIWKFLSSSEQQQQQNRGIAGLGEYIRNLKPIISLCFVQSSINQKNSLILAKNIYCLHAYSICPNKL